MTLPLSAPEALQMLLHSETERLEDMATFLVLVRRRLEKPKRKKRRYWIRPWIDRRLEYGSYYTLMAELEREHQGDFTNYMRMEPAMFYEVLQRLSPRITKMDTNWRKALPPGLKLAITLRFLASGDSYHGLAFSFRVPHNTISLFVPEVCNAIIEEYGGELVSMPTTEAGWREVSERFGARWNFHHTVGAIDGKHIRIKAPKNSGSKYFNYKGFFSIILLGIVDADYKFMRVDVGGNGASSDSSVFNRGIRHGLENHTLGFPAPDALPHDDRPTPYFLVGDAAFPLRTWMMKPYGQRNLSDAERIFNYRLSRARRVVENAFGILANRFRCLLTTLQQTPETVKALVLATICLHNLMRTRYPGLHAPLLDSESETHETIPGSWRTDSVLQDISSVTATNTATREGKAQRVYLKHYFNTIGAVAWQRNMI